MKNLFGLYVFVSTQNKILGMHSAPTNVVRIKSCVSLAVDVHFSRFLGGKKNMTSERVLSCLIHFPLVWAWPFEIRVKRIVFIPVDLKYLRFQFCT